MENNAAPLALRRILLPFDFSACSRRALTMATTLARRFGARLEVLYVRPSPALGEQVATLAQLAAASTWHELDELLRTECPADVETVIRFEPGHVVDAILRHASDANLVILGTHGEERGRLSHLLHGSVTEHVLRHSPCPVMTVP